MDRLTFSSLKFEFLFFIKNQKPEKSFNKSEKSSSF
jgi:hypothetical protein